MCRKNVPVGTTALFALVFSLRTQADHKELPLVTISQPVGSQTCWNACIRMVLDWYSTPETYQTVLDAVTQGQATTASLGQVSNYLWNKGIDNSSYSWPSTWATLKYQKIDYDIPLLMGLYSRTTVEAHMVVARGYDDDVTDQVIYYDPMYGWAIEDYSQVGSRIGYEWRETIEPWNPPVSAALHAEGMIVTRAGTGGALVGEAPQRPKPQTGRSPSFSDPRCVSQQVP
jgi:hypothetical protein